MLPESKITLKSDIRNEIVEGEFGPFEAIAHANFRLIGSEEVIADDPDEELPDAEQIERICTAALADLNPRTQRYRILQEVVKIYQDGEEVDSYRLDRVLPLFNKPTIDKVLQWAVRSFLVEVEDRPVKGKGFNRLVYLPTPLLLNHFQRSGISTETHE